MKKITDDWGIVKSKYCDGLEQKLEIHTWYHCFKVFYGNGDEGYGYDIDIEGKNLLKELPLTTVIYRFGSCLTDEKGIVITSGA